MLARFPRAYNAISEMAETMALDTKMARSIVRKGGLRQGSDSGEADSGVARVNYAVDACIDPNVGALNYQWVVDFTDCTHIRFFSKSDKTLRLWFSLAGADSDALNPGDYQWWNPPGLVSSGVQNIATVPNDTYWEFEIQEDRRTRLRLSLSEENDVWTFHTPGFTANDKRGLYVSVQAM